MSKHLRLVPVSRRAPSPSARELGTGTSFSRDFAAIEREHERRIRRTEQVGHTILGFIYGACLVGFFWLLSLWIDVGGLPYVSQ